MSEALAVGTVKIKPNKRFYKEGGRVTAGGGRSSGEGKCLRIWFKVIALCLGAGLSHEGGTPLAIQR